MTKHNKSYILDFKKSSNQNERDFIKNYSAEGKIFLQFSSFCSHRISISIQKADLPILRDETDFAQYKICQKLTQFSQVIQEHIKTPYSCCIGGHIFMTSTKND